MSFLENFRKTIVNNVFKRTLDSLFSKQGYSIKSEAELRQSIDNLQNALNEEIDINFETPRERTSSTLFNAIGEQIAVALQYLFNLYNELDKIAKNHSWIFDSQIADINRGLMQLQSPKNIKDIDSYTVVVSENFDTPKFLGGGQFQHTDRDGKIYGVESQCITNYGLTLSPYLDRNCMSSGTGYPLARAAVVHYTGTPIPQSGALIEQIVNDDVWQETIWANAPINIQPGVVYGTGEDSVALYGDIKGGAFCEFDIDFKYSTVITELILYPLSPYPMELVGVILYEGNGGIWHKVAENIILGQDCVIRFPGVNCSKVRFLLRQQHYERKTYLLNSEQLQELNYVKQMDEELWHPEITNIEERNFREQYRGWENIFSQPQKEKEQYSCYEYVYGLRGMGAREKKYRDLSVMVSDPLEFAGDARTIELTTEEEHPLVGNDSLTSIEYYIGCDNYWYPIQPIGKRIINERLFGPDVEFRFPVESQLFIYANGILFHDFNEIDNQHIKIKNYDPAVIYTACYTPMPDAYFLEIPKLVEPIEYSVGGRYGEYFEGTDYSGKITLSHTPYLDFNNLAHWEDVQNIDVPALLHSVEGVSPVTITGYKNITDYIYNTKFSPGDKEFIHYGRTIQFAAPVNEPLYVYYKYMGGDIRLKAVLRRNVHGYDSLTCVLKKYTLKISVA